MNACKKLLLVTFLASLPVVLIGMEYKEQALARIKKSGYLAKLIEGVDEDMTIDNYRMDRMATDLVNSRAGLYQGLGLQILAGCDTEILFAPDQNINFIQLCTAIIPFLESRHANNKDQKRVKKFLRKAVAANQVDIEEIKRIEVPTSHIALCNTALYLLLDQVAESDSESEAENGPNEVAPGDTSNTQLQHYTGPEAQVTEHINQEPAQVKPQEPAGHESDQKIQNSISTIRTYKVIIPVIGICVAAAIVYQWCYKKTKSPQTDVDPENDTSVIQEQRYKSHTITTGI